MASAYYLLDTFSKDQFKGNPTPVCLLHNALPVKTMHDLAKEFNAPVTAFVEPKLVDGNYPIRYFTVTGEIPACGHATLGAACILHSQTPNAQIIFQTIENILLRTRQQEQLTFIEYPIFKGLPFEVPATLKKALGIGHSEMDFYCKELQSLFIEVKTEEEVKQLSPDFKGLIQSSTEIKEVVVMSKGQNPNHDFVLRSFCPWIGIDEDPVTGSIHSVLGRFWQGRLNKNELIAYQASERGGHLFIRPLQHATEIGGYTNILVQGQLNL